MVTQPRVLIVDDNVHSTKILSLILQRKGYSVTTAKDGYEAIERVKKGFFHLTLVDIRMPGMDGLDTFRRIRQIRPQAAVVMMTAYAADGLIREAMREGACGVVYKPLDIPELLALIQGQRVKMTLGPSAE